MSIDTSPADLSATEARLLIAQRKLSPVELAQACIARTEAVNPAVNALIATDFNRVHDAARAAEAAVMRGAALGPLHGLPVAVKDMTDAAGLPTTYGSEAFAGNIAEADAPMVAVLRSSGALVMGKTNVPEWSAGANTINRVWGVTRNPHDLSRSAAGSSGGSAAALACGMAPLATGSDLGGSLRNPAAFCGVVGFRPSPGVVPGEAREQALLPLSTDGPMARRVADAALLLSVQTRPDPRDPYTPVLDGRTPWDAGGFAPLPSIDLKALRVAVTEDFGFAPTERMVRTAFRNALRGISDCLGQVEETSPDCADADRIFAVLRGVGFLGKHHDLLQEHPDKVGPNVRANVEEGLCYSAHDVARALIAQGEYMRRWQAFFEDHDLILCPAVCIGPRDWRELYPTEIDGQPTQSYYHWLAMAYASTIAGHPSISIPCGRDGNGMPFGLQIIGPRHGDRLVLAAAEALERVIAGTTLEVGAPDLAALSKEPALGLTAEVRAVMA